MKEKIDEVLSRLRPGIVANGGTMELIGIEEDSRVCLWQTEDEFSPEHIIWMHRLRVERAIQKVLPGAVVKFEMDFEVKV